VVLLAEGGGQRDWEYEWSDELDLLWPAVCEVAALLIDGQPVTHDDVLAAVERIDAQLDSLIDLARAQR
jgi:hypothetical protein